MPYSRTVFNSTSTGISDQIDVSGYDRGPIARVTASSTAVVRMQSSYDGTDFQDIRSIRANTEIELDPRRGVYRFNVVTNGGTIKITHGPGVIHGVSANPTAPPARA